MKEILIYPHKILKTKAEPVKNINQELQDLIDEMLETMYKAPGIGLAANQVGVLKQLAVIDLTEPEENKKNPIILINPKIIAWEGEEIAEEGCLSVPDYRAPVKRAARIQVVGYDRNEKEISIEAEGLLARCIQHELDHLQGYCFVDRLSPVKKALFRKKWAKLRAQAEKEKKYSSK